MAQISDIKLPNINTSELSNEKYAKKITNYLMSLEENMRYMFGNIDEDNITEHFVDTVVVKNLLITNGDNSIIINGDDGFQMLKGQKQQLYFDINTGRSVFGGEMIGGSLESANYTEDEVGKCKTGMRIDLTNGTFNTPFLWINEDGTVEASDTIKGPKIKSEFFSADGAASITMEMSDTEFTTYRKISGVEEDRGKFSFQGISFETSDSNSFFGSNSISLSDHTGSIFDVNYEGASIRGKRVITTDDLNDYVTKSYLTSQLEYTTPLTLYQQLAYRVSALEMA